MRKEIPEDHKASIHLGEDGKVTYSSDKINLVEDAENKLVCVQPKEGEVVVKISDHPENFERLSSMMVSLTNACNLSCNYCYEQHQVDYGKFTVESIKKTYDFLHEVNDLPEKNLIFFGGEPLIHKNLILGFLKEYDEILREDFYNRGTQINIVSNGLLLTEDFIEEYFSYAYTNIIISVDTFNAAIDERKISQLKLDKLKSLIKKIPLNVRHSKRVIVRPTISYNTARNLGHFLRTLYHDLEIRSFIMQPLIMGNLDGFLDWADRDWNDLRDEIFIFLRTHNDIHIEVTEGVGNRSMGNTCLNGYDILSVDPSGDFSGCFFFVNQKDKAGDLISGNIFHDRLFINREKQFEESFNKMQTTNEECIKCDLQDHCYQCPAGNLDTTGELFRPDGMCKRFVQFYLDIQVELYSIRLTKVLAQIKEIASKKGLELAYKYCLVQLLNKEYQYGLGEDEIDDLVKKFSFEDLVEIHFDYLQNGARNIRLESDRDLNSVTLEDLYDKYLLEKEIKVREIDSRYREKMTDKKLLYLTLMGASIHDYA